MDGIFGLELVFNEKEKRCPSDDDNKNHTGGWMRMEVKSKTK